MKKARWLSWSLAGVLSAWLGWASADPVILHGEVLEKGSGDPILGAVIYVAGNDSINATSDTQGRFTLTLPAPGDYILGVVAVGYEGSKQILDASASALPGLLKIYLRRDFTLPPVVVRAERNPERVAKTVVTREDLDKAAGSLGDPLRALLALPGIADAEGAPAIRGSGPDDNAYSIDGAPVGYLFHDSQGVSVLPANVVDDINLYAASFGPEYDDALGAVIDVGLRKPRTDRLGGNLDISLIGAAAFIEGPITANQSVLFSARRSYLDFLLGSIEDEESGDKFVVPGYYDYQGKYLWELNDAHSLTLNTHGAADSLGFTLTEKSEHTRQQPYLVGRTLVEEAYHTQNIVWSTRMSSTAVNKIVFGHLAEPQTRSIGSAGTVDARFDSVFLRDQFQFSPAPNHALTLGGSYTHMDVKLDFDILDIFSGDRINDPPVHDFYGAQRKQYKTRQPVRSTVLFAKDRWRVAPDLTLIGGVHWTHDDYLERAYTEPRLGLEWDWTPRTLITAGWGGYNQIPDGVVVFDVFGNPNLKRERATHNVLGVAQKLDAGWSWKLEGYYKTLDDVVISDPQVKYTNGASGTAHGVELLVKKDSPTLWSGWLSLAYSQSRRQIDATGKSLRFDFDQPLMATGVLSYKPSADWSFSARWNYHSGNPYTPFGTSPTVDPRSDGTYEPKPLEINSRRLPAYHRLDLRIEGHTIHNTWKITRYFEVINAYNRKNVDGYEYVYESREPTREAINQLPFLPFFGVEMEF